MQGSTIVKLLIAAAVLFFIWKFVGQQHQQIAKPSSTSPSVNCVFEARQASEYWGSNLHSFANPPYDANAWDDFKARVDNRISRTEMKCSCGDDACTRAKEAIGELRSMVSEFDSAIHSGSSPPTDAAQRQERIDNALNAAQDAAK